MYPGKFQPEWSLRPFSLPSSQVESVPQASEMLSTRAETRELSCASSPWRCCRLIWSALDILNLTTEGLFMVEDIAKACASFSSVPRGCGESPTKCQSTQTVGPYIPEIPSSSRFLPGVSRVFLVYRCDVRTGPQAWP